MHSCHSATLHFLYVVVLVPDIPVSLASPVIIMYAIRGGLSTKWRSNHVKWKVDGIRLTSKVDSGAFSQKP